MIALAYALILGTLGFTAGAVIPFVAAARLNLDPVLGFFGAVVCAPALTILGVGIGLLVGAS